MWSQHSILELGLSHLYLISLVDLVAEPQQNTPILELNKALIKENFTRGDPYPLLVDLIWFHPFLK